MCGDMVDTFWTVFRVVHVDVPDAQQQVTTIAGEFDVPGNHRGHHCHLRPYREREELFVNTLQCIGLEPLKERVYPKVLEVSRSCAGYQGTEATKLKCQIAAHRLPDCRIDLHQTKKRLIYLPHRLA